MQSEKNAWTYLALKQAKEMALQLLHPVATTGSGEKNNGHAGFGLFSLLLFVFFSSLSLLLCSAFFFLFSLFTITNRNSCFLRFICMLLSRFNSKAPSPSCLFSLLFPHSNTRMQKRNSLYLLCFFLLFLSCVFLVILFAVFFPALSFFVFLLSSLHFFSLGHQRGLYIV